MSLIKSGEMWGRITCLSAARIEVMEHAVDDAGQEYSTGIAEVFFGYVLRCECGREWEVRAGEFAGKRRVRDCGCGLGRNDGRPVIVSVSMPRELSDMVARWAEEKANGNQSLGVCMLLRAGLRDMDNKNGGEIGVWE